MNEELNSEYKLNIKFIKLYIVLFAVLIGVLISVIILFTSPNCGDNNWGKYLILRQIYFGINFVFISISFILNLIGIFVSVYDSSDSLAHQQKLNFNKEKFGLAAMFVSIIMFLAFIITAFVFYFV